MVKRMFKFKIVVILIVILFYSFIWKVGQPVEIVATHNKSVILVNNFPFFKSWQINWWEINKEKIHKKYGIPETYRDGSFGVVIHDFGNGYREDRWIDQDSDLLCFDDMQMKKNCIKKKILMTINKYKESKIYYR